MKSIATVALLACYVVTSVSGLLLLKLENDVLSVKFWAGAVLYGMGFLIWFFILKLLPLSIAFPLAAGCLIIGTQIGGYFYLGERIDTLQIIGLILIVLGIAAMSAGRSYQH